MPREQRERRDEAHGRRDDERAVAAHLEDGVEQHVVEPLQVDPLVLRHRERKDVVVGDRAVLDDPAARGEMPPRVEVVEAAYREGGDDDERGERQRRDQAIEDALRAGGRSCKRRWWGGRRSAGCDGGRRDDRRLGGDR
jgi:hypothetical protein